MRRFEVDSRLSRDEIERQLRSIAPSLLGLGAVPFIGQEMVHRGEQKRPEFSPLRISNLKRLLFQKSRKERLRQILSVDGRVATATHIGIERIPIGLAKLRQRVPCIFT